jgi:hypothetical protein
MDTTNNNHTMVEVSASLEQDVARAWVRRPLQLSVLVLHNHAAESIFANLDLVKTLRDETTEVLHAAVAIENAIEFFQRSASLLMSIGSWSRRGWTLPSDTFYIIAEFTISKETCPGRTALVARPRRLYDNASIFRAWSGVHIMAEIRTIIEHEEQLHETVVEQSERRRLLSVIRAHRVRFLMERLQGMQ